MRQQICRPRGLRSIHTRLTDTLTHLFKMDTSFFHLLLLFYAILTQYEITAIGKKIKRPKWFHVAIKHPHPRGLN